jgi:hypothetical protein
MNCKDAITDFYKTLTEAERQILFVEFAELLIENEELGIRDEFDDGGPDLYWYHTGEPLI